MKNDKNVPCYFWSDLIRAGGESVKMISEKNV